MVSLRGRTERQLPVSFSLHASTSQPTDKPYIGSEFDDVEGWIRNGGPVSFQGLGDLAELTVSKILSTFCERLENMSWGIAQRFRHVLMNLSREERCF